jgi:16S rRNA (cytosine967-C5)-methyltransferase
MPDPLTTRAIAAKILTETRKDKQFAAEALDYYPELVNKPAATDLIFGVIRNRRAIDVVIEKVTGLQIVHLQAKLLNIIRVAVYELIYCPQTADYAIVNEAVNYAGQITNQKGAGFVNWILRSTQKHIISRCASKEMEQVSPGKTIPQSTISCCEFDIELLPDRNISPSAYLGVAFSLPDWLVESWLAQFGPQRDICLASNRRPSIYARPNVLRTTVEELAGKFTDKGIGCEIIAGQQMIKLINPGAIPALPGFNEGLFTVQDLSAAQVVRILNPQPDWFILDLCAAPGTKTTQLAEATVGKAKVIATDIDIGRLQKVRENINRLDLSDCVIAVDYDALDDYLGRGGFDCVLVDAPCSNTGVLARRAEVRHRIKQSTIGELAGVQIELLSKAALLLKPGGVICYSTCSIQAEENRLLVERFLQNNPGFELKEEKQILPCAGPADHDGSYAAVISR